MYFIITGHIDFREKIGFLGVHEIFSDTWGENVQN
jgi:hypothetical protein